MKYRISSFILCVLLTVCFISSVYALPAVPEGYTKVGETSELALYFNAKEPSISVEDKRTGFVWNSAVGPTDYDMKDLNENWKTNLRSLFNFSYVNFKDSKGVPTPINSIMAKPKTSAKNIDKGISVTYEFANIKISLTVDIWLEGDALQVKVPADKLIEGDQYGITTLEILPFLGAASDDENGYILYPDGSGGLLNFKKSSHVDAKKYSWYIYGDDTVDLRNYMEIANTNVQQAMLPVYGVKRGDNALVAIVNDGEHDTAINLYPSGYVVNLNRISPEFTYRRSYKDARPNAKMVNKIERDIIKQDHGVKYVFLNKDKANYSGMANAYRKHLLDTKGIRKAIQPGEKVPLGLDLFMGISERQILFDKYISMTSFDQAKAIIGEFNKNGIDKMQINLAGWTDKGYGTFPLNLPPSKELGGKKGLKDLAAFAAGQSNPLYLQSNFIDAIKKNGGFSTRNDVVYSKNNLVVTNLTKERFILNPMVTLERFIKGFMPEVKNYGVSGVNFEKFGSLLYYDYHKKYPSNREKTSEQWKQFMEESAKNLGKAAVQGGNAYTLAYADRLFEIPVKDSGYFITDETVPFYQLVVHGMIPYSANAGNLFHDLERQKLTWVEYGCMPYYRLTYESANLLKNTNYNRLFSSQYTDWKDMAVSVYKEFNQRLGDVWSQEMLRHEKLQENVYKVTYSNGTTVYINYNESGITADGNSVKALDYLVVDKGGNKK